MILHSLLEDSIASLEYYMEHILYQVDPDFQRNVDPGLSEKVDPMPKITLLLKNSYLINSRVLILNMTIAFLKFEPKIS